MLVQQAVYQSLIRRFVAVHPESAVRAPGQFEASLWQLVTLRPAHLLDPAYRDWEQFLLQMADNLIEEYSKQYAGKPAGHNWGELNIADIRHPLSGAIPLLGDWLNMPAEPLAGDDDMPRVQSRSYGASERFAVSPGANPTGYFHMPGGQSGHPLSEYYRRGHELWVKGEMADFQPTDDQAHTGTAQPGAITDCDKKYNRPHSERLVATGDPMQYMNKEERLCPSKKTKP